jgi:hypothetical protein
MPSVSATNAEVTFFFNYLIFSHQYDDSSFLDARGISAVQYRITKFALLLMNKE